MCIVEKLPRQKWRHSGVRHGSANIMRGPLCASREGTGETRGDKDNVSLIGSSCLVASVFYISVVSSARKYRCDQDVSVKLQI